MPKIEISVVHQQSGDEGGFDWINGGQEAVLWIGGPGDRRGLGGKPVGEKSALGVFSILSGRVMWILTAVCNPATQRQPSVLEAGSPSRKWRRKKLAPNFQGRRRVKIQIEVNHIRL